MSGRGQVHGGGQRGADCVVRRRRFWAAGTNGGEAIFLIQLWNAVANSENRVGFLKMQFKNNFGKVGCDL